MEKSQFDIEVERYMSFFRELTPDMLAEIVMEALENRPEERENSDRMKADAKIEAAMRIEQVNSGWASFLQAVIDKATN